MAANGIHLMDGLFCYFVCVWIGWSSSKLKECTYGTYWEKMTYSWATINCNLNKILEFVMNVQCKDSQNEKSVEAK